MLAHYSFLMPMQKTAEKNNALLSFEKGGAVLRFYFEKGYEPSAAESAQLLSFFQKLCDAFFQSISDMGMQIPQGEQNIIFTKNAKYSLAGEGARIGNYNFSPIHSFVPAGIEIYVQKGESGGISFEPIMEVAVHELLHWATSQGGAHGWLRAGLGRSEYNFFMREDISDNVKKALFGHDLQQMENAQKSGGLIEGANSILTILVLEDILRRNDLGVDANSVLAFAKFSYLDNQAHASFIASPIGIDEFLAYYSLGNLEPVKKAFCSAYSVFQDDAESIYQLAPTIQLIAKKLGGIEEAKRLAASDGFYGANSGQLNYYFDLFAKAQDAFDAGSKMSIEEVQKSLQSLKELSAVSAAAGDYAIIFANASQIKLLAGAVAGLAGASRYDYLLQKEIEVYLRKKIAGETGSNIIPKLYFESLSDFGQCMLYNLEMNPFLLNPYLEKLDKIIGF